MHRAAPRHLSISSKHIFMCMLALVMVFRALVPTGFMPEQQALLDGKFAMTFCTADGVLSTMEIDIGTKKSTHAHAGADCLFGMVAHQTFDIPPTSALVPLASIAFAHPLLPSLNRSLPPLPALGPPLGSRAPPYLLG